MPRVNLVTNPSFAQGNLLSYPGFEISTAGWVAGNNTTIARTTAVAALSSTGAASLTSVAAGNVWINTNFDTVNSPAVVGGRTYTASAYVRSAASARTARVRLDWYSATNALMYSNDGTNTATSTSAWTRVSVTATAPADAVRVVVVLTVNSTAAGSEVHYADAFLLEQSTAVNAYYEVPGWLGNNTVVARTTYKSLFGSASLRITPTATSDTWAYTTPVAVAANKTYTLSAYVRSETTVRDMYVQITWYDAGGTALLYSGDVGGGSESTLTEWTRLTVTATAPALAATAVCSVVIMPPEVGEVHYADGVLLEQSTYASQWQDEPTQAVENTTMDLALKRVPVPHLTGAELNADIALGELVFNTVDEYGVVWVITQVEGWWNLPTPNMPSVDRGFADGTYDVRGRFESRNITLTGVILPPDRSKLPAARDRLLAAANLVYRGDWLRLDEGPVKSCWVRLVGQPTIDTVNPRGRTEFSLQLRAPDPVKYEWVNNDPDGKRVVTLVSNNKATSTETAVEVYNSGNTDVTAVFQVVGPIYGPNASIENLATGQVMTIVGSLRPRRTFNVTETITDLDGVSTVTLQTIRHNIRVGDEVVVENLDPDYDGTWTVTAVGDTTVSYYTGMRAKPLVSYVIGTLTAEADVLEVDTYDREVALNGLVEGARSQLDTLTDWTYLKPGPNQIAYYDDSQSPIFIRSYSRTTGTLVLSTVDPHGVYSGDSVVIQTPDALLTGSAPYVATASINTTATTIHLPDTRGVLSSTPMGPVVSTDTRAQAVVDVSWDNTTKTVTVETEADHEIAVGDYLTVDGGDVTYGGIDIGVSTATPVGINTYAFNTSTDVLTIVTASSTGYSQFDEIEIYNLGGDFDGVFTIASISGATITANVVSTTATFTSTSAPSEAAVRRVYRASLVTNRSIRYVKRGQSATSFSDSVVNPVAGRVYLLGNGTATVAYRSGWIS